MISCTEFIPAYSELFTYLENKYGRSEVDNFWNYLFKPDGTGVPLINFVEKDGIRGCFNYWTETLNEEAAEFTMYLNEKRGYFIIDMHSCPSKGRLLKLKDEIGIEPYHDYCLHCDLYRAAVEKVGLKYIFDCKGVDHASCSIFVYDPEVFDGRIIVDKDTEIMDRKAADNEYFHLGFHSSLNNGMEYLGSKYGTDVVKEYLVQYTNNVFRNVIKEAKENGIIAIENKIRDTYTKEKATDVVEMLYKPENDVLEVKIKYCPAVKYIKSIGKRVSKWYPYTTKVVMEVLAEVAGYKFNMKYYDEETGAAEYSFHR